MVPLGLRAKSPISCSGSRVPACESVQWKLSHAVCEFIEFAAYEGQFEVLDQPANSGA
jgi:hypothetical protein